MGPKYKNLLKITYVLYVYKYDVCMDVYQIPMGYDNYMFHSNIKTSYLIINCHYFFILDVSADNGYDQWTGVHRN